MPTCTFKRLSRQLLQYTHCQIRNQIKLTVIRRYSDCKCGCEEGGECTCGPECNCPHRKKPCPIGAKPNCRRDPPKNYAPECLSTEAFEIPEFMDPKAFRPIREDEQLGPDANKSNDYKNPEYFSYHRFSYYDLKEATRIGAECKECDE